MNTLQKILMGNALFSFISGVAMIVFYSSLAHIFEVPNEAPFLILGIGILLFSAFVFWVVKRLRSHFVLSIIVMDLLWVLGSLVLLLWRPFSISATGQLLIGVAALIVLSFALAQSKTLPQANEKGMKQGGFERSIKTLTQANRKWGS